MDSNTVAAAAVGAVVATGVTLIVNYVQKTLDTQAVQAEVNRAWDNGRAHGYNEGVQAAAQQEPSKMHSGLRSVQ